MKYLKGVTLIELMISLLISLIVISSIFKYYRYVKDDALNQKKLTHYQDTSRSLNHLFSDLIHADGHLGCLNLNRLPDFFKKKFEVLPNIDKVDSDVLYIQFVDNFLKLESEVLPLSNYIEVKEKPALKHNDLTVISDCQSAQILTINHVSWNKLSKLYVINFNEKINHPYSIYAKFGKLNSIAIYTYRKNNNTFSTLYLKKLGQPSLPLLDGIENLTFRPIEINKKIKGWEINACLVENGQLGSREWNNTFTFR